MNYHITNFCLTTNFKPLLSSGEQGVSVLYILAAKCNSQAKEGTVISNCSYGIIWWLGCRAGDWYSGRDNEKIFGTDKWRAECRKCTWQCFLIWSKCWKNCQHSLQSQRYCIVLYCIVFLYHHNHNHNKHHRTNILPTEYTDIYFIKGCEFNPLAYCFL